MDESTAYWVSRLDYFCGALLVGAITTGVAAMVSGVFWAFNATAQAEAGRASERNALVARRICLALMIVFVPCVIGRCLVPTSAEMAAILGKNLIQAKPVSPSAEKSEKKTEKPEKKPEKTQEEP